MVLLLRKIKQHRWYKELAKPFLEADDIPADPFGDLQTTENLLSVWEVHKTARIWLGLCGQSQWAASESITLVTSCSTRSTSMLRESSFSRTRGDPTIRALTVGIATSCSLARNFSRLQSCYSSTERLARSRSRSL